MGKGRTRRGGYCCYVFVDSQAFEDENPMWQPSPSRVRSRSAVPAAALSSTNQSLRGPIELPPPASRRKQTACVSDLFLFYFPEDNGRIKTFFSRCVPGAPGRVKTTLSREVTKRWNRMLDEGGKKGFHTEGNFDFDTTYIAGD